jgi:hypothetical protein
MPMLLLFRRIFRDNSSADSRLVLSHVQFQWNRVLENPPKPPDKVLQEGAVWLAKLCRSYDALTYLNALDYSMMRWSRP